MRRAAGLALCALLLAPAGLGCAGAMWDSRGQIYAAGLSQVRVRNAQSRSFDAVERTAMLEAVVAAFQDLGFQIEVLDEVLGIVSGRKYTPRKSRDAAYTLYDPETLVVLSGSGVFRSWGPFHHRSDLVRLTVTVRPDEGGRLIVRAAAQHDLEALEDPEPYQVFFRTLEQSLFTTRELGG